MNPSIILAALCLVLVSCQQQWTPQQLAAYRQQYYNWWYNQQRMQQVQQAPVTQAPVQAQTLHPVWGDAQSDSKGNFWHGDDNAKLLWVARSSWP